MEAFSPVGTSAPLNAAKQPSALRNSVMLETPVFEPAVSNAGSTLRGEAGRYPLLERLQSAIQSIEGRTQRTIEATPSQQQGTVNPELLRTSLGAFELEAMSRHLPPARPLESKVEAARASILDGLGEIETKPIMSSVDAAAEPPRSGAGHVDYGRIEKMIDASSRRLHDQLQSDMHSLHMDLLKQCLATQKHQEALFRIYLPKVKEVLEEVRLLREENERLRQALKYSAFQ